jgi:hypothetical protein
MSNPNSDLGEWILRKILNKKVGELVTMSDLIYFGIDSIYIEKVFPQEDTETKHFRISFTNVDYERYSNFIE